MTIGVLLLADSKHIRIEHQNNIPSEISVSQICATINSDLQLYCINKVWIPNNDNFKILSFRIIQHLENRNTNVMITVLDHRFKNSVKSPDLLIQVYLSIDKKTDLPILS
jgi:hypothetical protein